MPNFLKRRPERSNVSNFAPESLDRRIEGRRLEIVRYRASPAADRPTIVMLHEGLGSVSLWKDLPRAIAERTGCDVLAYSRYGCGLSERFDTPRDVDYMHVEAQRVLPELLAQFGITRPILLGHSDGASIAIVYAGTHPTNVSGLILEAPHVFVEDVGVASIASAKTIFETTGFREKLARHHADVDATFRGWNDIWLDPRFRAWNIESYLAPIETPVLVLQGNDDEYGTVAQLTAIERQTNARTVSLDRCGHAPHRDRRSDVLDEIERFVSSVVSESSRSYRES